VGYRIFLKSSGDYAPLPDPSGKDNHVGSEGDRMLKVKMKPMVKLDILEIAYCAGKDNRILVARYYEAFTVEEQSGI
jgi:hypothetical protein